MSSPLAFARRVVSRLRAGATTAAVPREAPTDRAQALLNDGRFREAADRLESAMGDASPDPMAHYLLGVAYLNLGDPARAEASLRRAIESPQPARARAALMACLLQQRHFDQALAVAQEALAIDPRDADALSCLGQCCAATGDGRAAEQWLRRALDIDSERADLWNALGAVLRGQDRRGEALEAFQRAESLAHGSADNDAFVDVALELQIADRIDEAIALLEANLPQRPALTAHRGYADALLTAGRLREAWSHYEFRWMLEPLLSVRASGCPPWTGQDLTGKSLLLRVEQGFGDMVQFLRYAPMVKALGATVYLGRFSDLADLIPGVDRVFGEGDEVPAFDYYVNVMSLPGIFGTDLATIPAQLPYRCADPARAAEWASRVPGKGRLNIALVWAGSADNPRDRYRSMRLQMLAPVLRREEIDFYSLQKGPPAAEWSACGLPHDHDLGADLADFADTAAAIARMDLVICVDTAVAHLAGALGKPVWLMIPTVHDWRWLTGRDDSPWYPTMRLFRQQRHHDWGEVVDRLGLALDSFPKTRNESPGTTMVDRVHVNGNAFIPAVALPRPGMVAAMETRDGILQYRPDDPFSGEALRTTGAYPPDLLDLTLKLVEPGAWMLEVGAGVGAHALGVSRHLGAAGHLILWEARASYRRALRNNLAANRIANATVLRSYTSVDALELGRLDWLRIAPGCDAISELEGASDTLWSSRASVVVEMSPDAPSEAVVAKLGAFGYRMWTVPASAVDTGGLSARATRRHRALLAIAEERDTRVDFPGCIPIEVR
jgi:tetratricopeptide (TPR) repeat protein